MKLSDVIENFLLELLGQDTDIILKRNELATQFNCAPSQINYVIDTRFTGQRGYIVESQRGGGGYIRIHRVNIDQSNYLMHVINSVGTHISFASVQAFLANMAGQSVITDREMRLILTALSDRSIGPNHPDRDAARAEIFKNMLLRLI